jgi:hypothetical protein
MTAAAGGRKLVEILVKFLLLVSLLVEWAWEGTKGVKAAKHEGGRVP